MRRVASARVYCALGMMLLSGCVKYRPGGIDPPRLEAQYRQRSLDDPGLRAFVQANAGAKEISWPPRVLDSQELTLVALYYNPEIAVARAELAAANAAVITAGAR